MDQPCGMQYSEFEKDEAAQCSLANKLSKQSRFSVLSRSQTWVSDFRLFSCLL